MESTPSSSTGSRAAKIISIAAISAGGTAMGVAAGTSALAAYFARRVITPDRMRSEEEILATITTDRGLEIILKASGETTSHGTFSLHFDNGAGHARIGEVTSYSPAEGTVQRRVEAVYKGDLDAARWGHWGGATYEDPSSLGLEYENVLLSNDIGEFPVWKVPAAKNPSLVAQSHGQNVWAIMVHGRGATRLEGLRALPVAQELGLTSLLISYRNDGDAPSADQGRYGLGTTEWREVETAMAYAVEQGATDLVLFGWSMGGAVSLQATDLAANRHLIRALVLDAPVINWVDVLAFQARLNRIPAGVGRYGQLMLSHPVGRRVTGLAAPVDLKSMDWVSRSMELRTPSLIMHSLDDDFVPYGPGEKLAAKNPEMVTFVPFHGARHTREWNVDRILWEGTVRDWLSEVLGERSTPGGQ